MFILEHYVDGDQVNCHTKTNISPASPDGLHVWGKHKLHNDDTSKTNLLARTGSTRGLFGMRTATE